MQQLGWVSFLDPRTEGPNTACRQGPPQHSVPSLHGHLAATRVFPGTCPFATSAGFGQQSPGSGPRMSRSLHGPPLGEGWGLPAPDRREVLPGLTSFLVASRPAHALRPRTPSHTLSLPSVPWGRYSGGGVLPRERAAAPGRSGDCLASVLLAHTLCPQLTCVSAQYRGPSGQCPAARDILGGKPPHPSSRPAHALLPLVQDTEGLRAEDA